MQRYNNAINWHMPLLVNFDNYFFQVPTVCFVVSISPMSGPCDRDHHNVVRKQFVMICVGMLVDSVAPLIGTKLQCLVLIKSIVIVTTWSSRNIWWSKYPNKIYRPSWLTKSYSVRPAAKQVMLRWVGHKFWEIFCTNNCFIFRETACLTFVKQNLDNEIHFFVSSPFALRHTKQQQMVFSFASWRFLYLFFYKFYLNTTVENMNIRWIDLTNNKAGGTGPCDILTGNRCPIWPSCQSLTTSPLPDVISDPWG